MKLLEALEQLNIDTKTLLERFSGNTALLERFILKFPQDKTFESLCTAVEVLDYDNMERTAHTLKGIAANLSFDN